MGRKRNNSEEDLEKYEQEIKELKSIIRHLQKELKKSNKSHKVQYIEDEPEQKNHKTCPECFRGQLKEVVLGSVRMFIKCTDCDYRTKTVKINK